MANIRIVEPLSGVVSKFRNVTVGASGSYESSAIDEHTVQNITYTLDGSDADKYTISGPASVEKGSVTKRDLNITAYTIPSITQYDENLVVALTDIDFTGAISRDRSHIALELEDSTATYNSSENAGNQAVTLHFGFDSFVDRYNLSNSLGNTTGHVNEFEKIQLSYAPSDVSSVGTVRYGATNLDVTNSAVIDQNNVSGIDASHPNVVVNVASAVYAGSDIKNASDNQVTVIFSLSGSDAKYYNAPSSVVVTGIILPAILTASNIAVEPIAAGSADLTATVNIDSVTGKVGSDNVSVVGSGSYPDTNNPGTTDLLKTVPVTLSISGGDAAYYVFRSGDVDVTTLSTNVSGVVTGRPIVWYTGIIPKAYIETDGVTNWHTNPYATNINDLAVLNDANSDGVSDDGKDIQTIINGLSGKTVYSGIRSASDVSSLALTFGSNNTDWVTALDATGVDNEVREDEFSSYAGYPFILTNQSGSYVVKNANNDTIPFGKVVDSIVVDGSVLSGSIALNVYAASAFVNNKLEFN